MGELHIIDSTRDQDQKSVIAMLEHALAEAQESKIRGIAIAVVRPDLALNTHGQIAERGAFESGGRALVEADRGAAGREAYFLFVPYGLWFVGFNEIPSL